MTPLWGAIPPSSGNAYYDAVNKALGATLKIQPADGNNYGDELPPLFAADKLPDWIQIPGWNTATSTSARRSAPSSPTSRPYLAGDKVKAYPNLANIPTGAWAAGVWNGKLYGLPVYPAGAGFAGTYFYRKDIFDKLGINADGIKTADDLAALGKQLTNADGRAGGRSTTCSATTQLRRPALRVPRTSWGIDSSGKLVHKYETDGHHRRARTGTPKLVKAGYVHPDAIAGNTPERQAAVLERQGR